MTDKTFIIQVLQLLIGGGMLVMMGRLLIAIGNYTARLEGLEKAFEAQSKKVDEVHHDVAEMKGYLAAKTGMVIGS